MKRKLYESGMILIILSLSMVLCQSAYAVLPPCTNSIADTDNDGVTNNDVDKDGDGLIEICDLDGLNEIRHRLDGAGYQSNPMADTIMTGCPSDGCRGYELTRNLDFTTTSSYRVGEINTEWTEGDDGWLPIGHRFVEGVSLPLWSPFEASFHGNGHTISNLRILSSGNFRVGMFSFTGTPGSITSVHLSNVFVTGNSWVGGLAGENLGRITNSSVTGRVGQIVLFGGGLVGQNNGVIIGSNADVSIMVASNAERDIGGLVGLNNGGTIENSYATGNLNGDGRNNVGGLVGNNGGTIINSYATGNVSGGSNVGGFIGINNRAIEGNYATGNVSGGNNVGGFIGSNSRDITGSHATGSVTGGGNSVGGLIGSNSAAITDSHATGSVTGNNNNVGGLIGSNSGDITNSYHATGSVTGSGNNVGGFIGSNNATVINSYHATGSVTGSGNNVGGFIGLINRSNSGNIINSYATGDVIGAAGSMDVGGFIGKSSEGNKGNIINSHATGDVTGAAGVDNIGGFIGFIDSLSNSANEGDILNSYATGDVTGSADKTGGFIGSIDDNMTGAISNNYATGNVSGNTKVGGFIGEALSTTITSVYAVGNVSGNTEVGGLVGAAGAGFGTNNSYWDRERSGTEMSAGGEAKTTVELQSTEIGEGIYEQWSQTDWYSGTSGDYPILRYTRGTGVISGPTCVDEGQPNDEGYPICNTFLDTDRFLGLQALTISTIADPTTNLLQDNFEVERQNYTLSVLPTIEALRFEPIPVSDEVTVEVDGKSFNTSATVALNFTQNKDEISITVAAEGSTATYTITVYQTGLCDNNGDGVINNQDDIDMDDDGLIELCLPIGLDAIRYQLDGSAYRAADDAPPITQGCSNNTDICSGYELQEDFLNLDESFDNWQPIGDDSTPFAATFDGNGHIISGLKINRPSSSYIGLFGYTAQNSTITNVGLMDIAKSVISFRGNLIDIDGISGLQYVGGLVGKNEGTIGNSYVSSGLGIVENPDGPANNEHVGGLVGDNTGTIINSYAALPVAGTHNNVGGLVGKNSGDIKNSYATGNITGGNRVGGLVGYLESGGTIERSYAAGRVSASGAGNVGGLVGFADNTNNEVVDSHWDTITSGQTNSDGGTAQITTALQRTLIETPGIYANWSADDWFSGSEGDYPVLRYAIINESIPLCGQPGQPVCGDLLDGQRILALRTLILSRIGKSTNLITQDFVPHITTYTLAVSAGVTTLEISVEPYDSGVTVTANDMAVDISTKTEIQIQGLSVLPITVVSGEAQHTYFLKIERSGICDADDIDRDGDGLIELCLPVGLSAIRHQLDGSGYKADADAPIVTDGCNYNNTGTCRGYELSRDLDLADDEMSWQPIGNRDAGFAAIFDGNNYTISNLRITTTSTNVGLFAYTAENSTITNVGLLSVNVRGGEHVGSLVGTNSGTITDSYARGTVSATGSNVGGFIGTNSGIISNSYAESKVTGGTEGGRNTGGFIGTNNGTITDSYAIGNVTGGAVPSTRLGGISSSGGFIGLNSGAVRNSYATGDVTVATTQTTIQGVGGFIGFIQQLNSSNIINSYATGDVSVAGMGIAGGFIGYIDERNSGDISNSYATGDVTVGSGGRAGGFIGYIDEQNSGDIRNTYASGDVSGGAEVGGFIGIIASSGSGEISNSYARGRVSGSGDVGGFIGSFTVGSKTTAEYVIASYWDTERSGTTNSDGGIPQTTAALQRGVIGMAGIYAAWSPNDWDSGTRFDYPIVRFTKGDDPENPLCGGEERPCTVLAAQFAPLNQLVLLAGTETLLSRQMLQPAFDPDRSMYRSTIRLQDNRIQFMIASPTTRAVSYQVDDGGFIDIENGVGINPVSLPPSPIAIGLGTTRTIIIRVPPLETQADQDSGGEYTIELSRGNIIFGGCDANDIDMDDDGLIEICSPVGLDAIRYQLDGSGYKADANLPIVTDGCNYNNTGRCRGYELGQDLDLAGEMNWQPIGNRDAGFAAIFDGNNHTISNLSITTTSTSVGLFAYTAQNSTITNVGLLGVNVRGGEHVGSLVGTNSGAISNSYARGAVSAMGSDAGGFIGSNNGTISNSYARGTVSATGSNAGGFIGTNSGTITDSYAESEVTGGTEGGRNTGGFIGANSGTITDSYAIGNVTGGAVPSTRLGGISSSGGFIGLNSGAVRNSYATGDVTVATTQTTIQGVGGFIGFIQRLNSSDIINSYATGDVSVAGMGIAGGFIGYIDEQNSGDISNSYATGDVSVGSGGRAGGFIAYIGQSSSGTIRNTYAAGDVSGGAEVGGFIGFIQRSGSGEISDSYARGRVSGSGANIGGFIGSFTAGSKTTAEYVIASYWDTERSGTTNSVGGTPQTTAALQEAVIGVAGIYEDWSTNDWDSGTRLDYPIIRFTEGDDPENPLCGGEERPCTVLAAQYAPLNQLVLLAGTETSLSRQVLRPAFDPDRSMYRSTIRLQDNHIQFMIASPTTRTVSYQVDDGGFIDLENGVGISPVSLPPLPISISLGTTRTIVIRVPPLETQANQNSGGEYTIELSRESIILGVCDTGDIDRDDDGLIEICSPVGLDAIRYQLDGSGYKADADAPIITDGCNYNNTGTCRGYELGRDLDLAGEMNWQPIGNSDAGFAAIFDGNNRTISNLRITTTSTSVGLFAYTAQNSTITNVGLLSVNVRGGEHVGSLVGTNSGTISNSYAIGTVSATGSDTGGLIGTNSGVISNSHARGTVSATGSNAGGFIGTNGGTITNSYAESEVTGGTEGGRNTGGFIGTNSGTITDSYAIGNVIGGAVPSTSLGGISSSGGFIGLNSGAVRNSYATGDVTVATTQTTIQGVGGFIGFIQRLNSSDIINSYATGDVSVAGMGIAGGFIGYIDEQNSGDISNSYATGDVSVGSGGRAGGFIAYIGQSSSGTIRNTYAAGDVSGGAEVGGFIGIIASSGSGEISDSYARGRVSGSGANIGGFIGSFTAGSKTTAEYVIASYWDTERSGTTNSDGGIPQTTAALQEAVIGVAGGIYEDWSTDDWDSGTRLDYPIIRFTEGDDLVNPLCGGEGRPCTVLAAQYAPLNQLVLLAGTETSLSRQMLEPGFDPDRDMYRSTIRLQDNHIQFMIASPTTRTVSYQVDGGGFIDIEDDVGINPVSLPPSPIAISLGTTRTIVIRVPPLETQANQDSGGEYTIELSRESIVFGGCDASDIDRDGDGLIEICSPVGLDAIRYQLDGSGYKADADAPIIMDGCNYNNTGRCRGYELGQDLDLVSEMNWQPIGSRDARFAAIFDGNNRTISNLRITTTSTNVGLFAYTAQNSTITNVGLLSVNVRGGEHVGSLVGTNSGAVSNSYARGTVSATGSSAGGFVGTNDGTISNSYAECEVTGGTEGGRNTGGFIGTNGGTITDSYAIGNVTVATTQTTIQGVGGFIGLNSGAVRNSYATGDVTVATTQTIIQGVGGFIGFIQRLNNSDIINSYATGDVTVAGMGIAGGFIGYIDEQNSGDIINSYATGDVSVGSGGHAGGFIGDIGQSSSGTIRNTYAAGDVSGGAEIGGFIGIIASSGSGEISNSYARGRVSGDGANVGGFIGSFTVGIKTTAEYVIASYWDTERSGTTNSVGGTPQTTAALQESVIGMAGGIYEDWSTDDWDSGTRFDYPIVRFTEGDDMVNPLCGSEERPCTVLPSQFAPLNQLVLLAGTEASLSRQMLEPGFDPDHRMYRSTIDLQDNRIQFMIASPTTRTVSYQVDDGGFINTPNSVGISPVSLPPSPIAIGLGATRTIIIRVPPLETQTNQDSGGEYTIEVRRGSIVFGGCDANDIDRDDDGLIEICSPVGLDVIRYQLDGSGYKANADAPIITDGCNYNNTGRCRGYELGQDLDLVSEMNWQPIGNRDAGFAAIFDGNDHTISNLRITTTFTSVGLFAYTAQNSTITNVGLLSVNVRGGEHVGSLVGTNSGAISNSYARGAVSAMGSNAGGFIGSNGGTISNSYAESEVTGGTEGGRNTGGFIGTNSGTITDSYAIGNVTGGAVPSTSGGISSSGGFIGLNSGAVRNSYATGDVTVATTQTIIQGVGGFIGFIQRLNNSDIINSYATGDVTVAGMGIVGGFIGYIDEQNSGDIRNSYATGDVSVGSGGRAGGFIGDIGQSSSGTIRNTYAAGDVSGGAEIGGFIGIIASSGSGEISNSYARGRVSGDGANVGGFIGSFTVGSKTTAEYVIASYWDTERSGTTNSDGGIPQTTVALQESVIGMAGGIYEDWSTDDWDSGTRSDYPIVRFTEGDDMVNPLCGSEERPCTVLPSQFAPLNQLVLLAGTEASLSRQMLQPAFDPDHNMYRSTIRLQDNHIQFMIASPTTRTVSYQVDDRGFIDIENGVGISPVSLPPSPIAIGLGATRTIIIRVPPLETQTNQDSGGEYTIEVRRGSIVFGGCDANDIDRDDDGLIEICSPVGLDVIRYQLDGSGYKANADAPIIMDGCNYNNTGRCRGYELGQDLDLVSEMNWQPIGSRDARFAAIFDGNDHTISNLRITTTFTSVGLFAYTAQNSTITNVGLLSVNVSGGEHVGSLVGTNSGAILNSYAIGTVSATDSNAGGFIGTNSGTISNSYAECEVTGGTEGGRNTGGFIGTNSGTIRNGYAAGDVSGGERVGGFIGLIEDSGSGGIANSYSRGRVSGSSTVGGFIGFFTAGSKTTAEYVIASYWDTERSGTTNSAGGTPQTTAALQEGIIGMAGIYEDWSTDDWDSGTRFDYPILKPTEGDDPANPLCGGEERPCDILPAQFAPLNQLVLLAGTEASLSRQMLQPGFDPDHNMYRSTIDLQDNRIQFMIASPTTRTVSYQVDDGGFIDIENGVGISPVSLPPSPIAIGLGATRTIIIRVPPLETQTNQDSGGEYTIEVRRGSIVFGGCDANDIDRDDDGLIEICSPVGLDVIRHQLDGSGYKANADAPIITDGCNYNNTGRCRGYELGQDLDLADEMNWQPIGNSDARFAAIFDGNNHTISNLRITTTSTHVGLFAYTAQNSTITNVGLLSANVSGGEHVGSLVGTNRGAISNSYARGVVSATGSNAGGFIGTNSGTILNSYAECEVTGGTEGGRNTGGFIGTNSGTIRNSYAAGDVSGDAGVGGFIGTNSGAIRNSYAAGDVSGGAGVGGFIGFIQSPGSGGIANSYSRGRVSGSSTVGGFIGSFPDGTRTAAEYVTASYWDTERSGRTNSAGGTSQTTAALQRGVIGVAGGIYADWSTDDWDSGTRFDYPILKPTEGDDPANPLCGGEERPCDILPAQYAPLNQLVLLAGTEASLSRQMLEPGFDPDHNMYRSTVHPQDDHIQFMIAASTTRTVSYQVDGGEFIDIENGVGISPVSLPPSPISIGLGTTRTIIIRVPPLETQTNQDSGGEYTIEVNREAIIFVELRLFLEGALLRP